MNEKQITTFKFNYYDESYQYVIEAISEKLNMKAEITINKVYKEKKFRIYRDLQSIKCKYQYQNLFIPKRYIQLYDTMLVYAKLTEPESRGFTGEFLNLHAYSAFNYNNYYREKLCNDFYKSIFAIIHDEIYSNEFDIYALAENNKTKNNKLGNIDLDSININIFDKYKRGSYIIRNDDNIGTKFNRIKLNIKLRRDLDDL